MAVRKRIVECVLSPESIDSAIKELQDYKDELQDKHKQLVDRLATGVHIWQTLVLS